MYMSTFSYAQPAMTRDDLTGFRLIQHVSPGITKDELVAPLKSSVRDYSKETPVSDEVFNVLREQLTYERGNLNAVVESVDESNPSWTKEKVLINTGYDKERFPIYIFKPKSEGPHEVVIYFWGLSVFMSRRSNDELEPMWLDFIINSGRSLVVPVYAGSFERYMGFYESSNEKNSDPTPSYLRQWRSDLGRTLDYLETRNDVGSNFAYLGFSFGASTAVPLLAIEERFKAAVLVLGGLRLGKFKTTASDPFNYISRIKLPVLMLNGRYDHFFPSESSSLPFFNLLGTPIADKRQVLFDTGHLIPSRSSLVRETVEWLDKYQGK